MPSNRPITATHARTGAVTSTYQSLTSDVVTQTTDAGNRTTAYSFDLRGRTLAVDLPDSLDENGNNLTNITNTIYLDNGQVGEVLGGQVYRRSYTYDYALRQKTLLTYGTTNATTTWNYNPQRGWLDSKTYADGKGTNYTYTAAGRLKTETKARGITTTYAYDTAGRNITTTYSDNLTKSLITTYDRLSRVIEVQQGAENKHEYSYHADTFELLKEKISYRLDTANPFVRELNRSQDNILRPSSVELNTLASLSEHKVDYSFDDAGRLKTVTNNANAQADGYTYDYLANSSSLVAKITGTLMKTENVYETTRNLRTDVKNYAYLAWQQSGYFHLKNHDQYDYNAIGQRTEHRRGGAYHGNPATPQTWFNFKYNSKGELAERTHSTNATLTHTFQQDGIGNRTQKVANTNHYQLR